MNLRASVIINNYNYARFLETCIESVLAQTYPDIELIIVDDGSTDNSREILERYKDRAKLVFKENGGETSGRNEGFLHASGDLVAFLDADDFWKPHAVETVMRSWKVGLSKLQFHLQVVDDVGRVAGALMPRCRLDEGRVEKLLLSTGRYVTCPTSGNFYSRQFLARIFPVPVKEWPQSMDSYAATYAGFYGEIRAIQEPLGFYRVHGQNTTQIAQEQVDLKQVEKLMGRGQRLRDLIFKIARELNVKANPGIVIHHWLYLKLELAQKRLSPEGSVFQLWATARRMLVSCLTARDLSFIKRIELIVWTVSAVLLPRYVASPVIKLGFDLAPRNRLIAALRRF